MSRIPPAKRDLAIGQGDEPVMGDGDAVGVSAEITQGLLGTTEGRFAIDHPVMPEQLAEPSGEDLGVSERLQIAIEAQLSFAAGALQRSHELAAKNPAQHLDGKKERVAGVDSSGCDPARVHRMGPHNGRGDDDTHAHSTLSAEDIEVQVFYPFHPLHGATVRILRRPERGEGAVSVIDRAGKRLKIPVWMLSPEAAGIMISERVHLSKEALLDRKSTRL